MRHCLAYHGAFERNFPSLRPGTSSFEGTDGEQHGLPEIPEEVDGVRIFYMEKAGKKFTAVRVQAGPLDVVVQEDLLLQPGRHMSYSSRFAPEPTIIDDVAAAAILEDLMKKNPEQRTQLVAVRGSFSVTSGRKSAD